MYARRSLIASSRAAPGSPRTPTRCTCASSAASSARPYCAAQRAGPRSRSTAGASPASPASTRASRHASSSGYSRACAASSCLRPSPLRATDARTYTHSSSGISSTSGAARTADTKDSAAVGSSHITAAVVSYVAPSNTPRPAPMSSVLLP